MKQLIRLLIVAMIAGAVATVIVQRDRLRQMDREQFATQIREGIQSVLKRGEEAALATAEAADAGLDTAAESVEQAAETVADAAEQAAEAVEQTSS